MQPAAPTTTLHPTPVPWWTSSLYVLEHSRHSVSVELLDGSPGETDGSPDEIDGSLYSSFEHQG